VNRSQKTDDPLQKVKGVVLGGKLQNRRTGEQKIRLQEIGRTGYQENREFRRNQKLKGHRHKCTRAQRTEDRRQRMVISGSWLVKRRILIRKQYKRPNKKENRPKSFPRDYLRTSGKGVLY